MHSDMTHPAPFGRVAIASGHPVLLNAAPSEAEAATLRELGFEPGRVVSRREPRTYSRICGGEVTEWSTRYYTVNGSGEIVGRAPRGWTPALGVWS